MIVITVFYVGIIFSKKKNPVVLTTIYVETTVNVFGSENTPIKNCCNNSFFMQIFSFFKKKIVLFCQLFMLKQQEMFLCQKIPP